MATQAAPKKFKLKERVRYTRRNGEVVKGVVTVKQGPMGNAPGEFVGVLIDGTNKPIFPRPTQLTRLG